MSQTHTLNVSRFLPKTVAPTSCADTGDLLDVLMRADEEAKTLAGPLFSPDLAARVEALEAKVAAIKADKAKVIEAPKVTPVAKTAKAPTATPTPAKGRTLASFPKRLRGGTWGGRVRDGEPTPKIGDRVKITTRAGKTWYGTVTRTWGRTFAYSKGTKAKAKAKRAPERTCQICLKPESRWGSQCFA